jgi:hypothetical protein
MSVRLHAYQRLERVMLELDAAGDPLADQLRDLMDPLWYALSDEEHALLDARFRPRPPSAPNCTSCCPRRLFR